MRVLFSGSREWTETGKIAGVIAGLLVDAIVVHGACPHGADKIVAKLTERSFNVEPHPAQWKVYGAGAGNIRNQEMIDTGIDCAYFFWNGLSPGTKDCIERALKAKIPHRVIAAKGRDALVQENYYRLLGVQVELCYDKVP